MSLLEAIFMGIVQGLAEFLPISSSGHLAIFKYILKINTDTGLLFDVLLHLGTLLAVFAAFREDIRQLLTEGFAIIGNSFYNLLIRVKNMFSKNKTGYRKVISTPYRRFVMLVIVSTIPTGILGIVFEDVIEFSGTTLLIPGLFLILTAILLMLADRVKTGNKDEQAASYKDAGLIGIAQGIATMPGLSRSGTTITACLLCGFDKSFAVKYSFIMSIPAVLGALLLELKDFRIAGTGGTQLLYYLIGTAVAGIIGYISIRTMLVIVRGRKFRFFAFYCMVLGLLAVIGQFTVA